MVSYLNLRKNPKDSCVYNFPLFLFVVFMYKNIFTSVTSSIQTSNLFVKMRHMVFVRRLFAGPLNKDVFFFLLMN